MAARYLMGEAWKAGLLLLTPMRSLTGIVTIPFQSGDTLSIKQELPYKVIFNTAAVSFKLLRATST